MSSTWTSGRHGVPSLVIRISFVVQARPARLFSTMSNRIRGDAPYAVALRMYVGAKSLFASFCKSLSTSVLQMPYAVCGLTGESSATKSPPDTPYTLQDDIYTNRRTPD